MPNRLVCGAILVFWGLMTFELQRRDVLPDLLIGPPPDMRTVTKATEANPQRTRWAIQVSDLGDKAATSVRVVGQVDTRIRASTDGWCRFMSDSWLDTGALLRGTPLDVVENQRVLIRTVSDIDGTGNLDNFRATVHLEGDHDDLLTISGTVRQNELVVTARSPLSLLDWRKTFPYQPREMVQHELSPLEAMPNLRVGQRWRSQIVSPLTGRVETAQISVDRKKIITWDSNPVTTFEIVTHVPPLTARTWARSSDGLVLRQEIPFPFARVTLERVPERFIGPSSRSTGP